MGRKHTHCTLCGQPAPRGLKIGETTICHWCERQLLTAEPGELQYDNLVEKVKRLWSGRSAPGENPATGSQTRK
ncbi:MAG: sigma factor G inhibitor Gin [Bacillota bacterium]